MNEYKVLFDYEQEMNKGYTEGRWDESMRSYQNMVDQTRIIYSPKALSKKEIEEMLISIMRKEPTLPRRNFVIKGYWENTGATYVKFTDH